VTRAITPDEYRDVLTVAALVADGRARDAHAYVALLPDDELRWLFLVLAAVTQAGMGALLETAGIPDTVGDYLRHMTASVDDWGIA
jgi:hypothetical protein